MDSNEVVIEKLLIKPVGMTMTMRADCNACKRKIDESPYESRHEYEQKKEKWKNNIRECPFCGVRYKGSKDERGKRLCWRGFRGGQSAMAKNGEFTITKFRGRWIWTFRYYGENETRAENQGTASSKEVAERMCERHKEWMV